MIHVTLAGTDLGFDENSLLFSVSRNGSCWNWDKDYNPTFTIGQEEIPFSSASSVSHEMRETGLGRGILSRYEGFAINGEASGLSFATYAWIEGATGDVFFEWIPLREENVSLKSVQWPGYMEFHEGRDDWYTLLNQHQGLLIPNTWETALGKLPFSLFNGIVAVIFAPILGVALHKALKAAHLEEKLGLPQKSD